jgi:hypothetical protein
MLGPAQVNRGHAILKARRIGGQIYREPLAITGTDPGSPHRAAATEAYMGKPSQFWSLAYGGGLLVGPR